MNDMSQNVPPPQARAIQPEEPLTATLAAQDWNVVFAGLGELPMRVARPVYDRIIAQFNHGSLP